MYQMTKLLECNSHNIMLWFLLWSYILQSIPTLWQKQTFITVMDACDLYLSYNYCFYGESVLHFSVYTCHFSGCLGWFAACYCGASWLPQKPLKELIHGEYKNHNNHVANGHTGEMSHKWHDYRSTQASRNLQAEKLELECSRLKTDHSLLDYTPFVTACFFEMTFSPALWTDVLMMHEMCRLAVLVLFQCAVPASKLVIGASMSYLWDWSCLFKERGPFLLCTWEQVSKCHLHWFIFHVRMEMSQPSIIPALKTCPAGNIF